MDMWVIFKIVLIQKHSKSKVFVEFSSKKKQLMVHFEIKHILSRVLVLFSVLFCFFVSVEKNNVCVFFVLIKHHQIQK